MNYKNDEQGRRAIRRAASESNLNADLIDINTFTGISGAFMDQVAVHFPGGHGMGTYEEVLAVFNESKSFDELGKNFLEKRLWNPIDLPRFDPWTLAYCPSRTATA